ncbi:MAG TPA: Crp/Fnr family transcriptional regulator [Candidatus Saccharimonadales bacterium]|nr:Crp/Fnr family transcriptional regulator [Candidatus Saccharimonadales bacterium]
MFGFDLDHPDMAGLKKHLKTLPYKKGTIILNPLEETDYVHVIQDGFVKAYTVNARGEEAIAAIFGRDDFFPLAWIIGQKRHFIYVQAISDCTITLLPLDKFEAQLKVNVNLTYAVMQKILEQFMLYSSTVNNLSLKYGRERLAYRLLLLAAKFGDKRGNAICLPHISQFDLAAMVNVSREGISREMSRFDRMGILKYSSKGIEIHDIKALHKELGENIRVMFYDRPSR